MALTTEKSDSDGFAAAIGLIKADFEKYLAKEASQFHVLNSMSAVLDEAGESDQYFIGKDEEGVVALLIVSGGFSKKIDELVAKKGFGGRMVEFAMNVCNGRATLDSFDAASTTFWSRVGFLKFAELPAQQAQGGCKMRLVCPNSEKWYNDGENNSGAWHLIRPAIRDRKPQPYRGLGVGRREQIRP